MSGHSRKQLAMSLRAADEFDHTVMVSAMPFPCRFHHRTDAQKKVMQEAPSSTAAAAIFQCTAKPTMIGDFMGGVVAFGPSVFEWEAPTEEKKQAFQDSVYTEDDMGPENTRVVVFVSIVTAKVLREKAGVGETDFVPSSFVTELTGIPHIDVIIGFADHGRPDLISYGDNKSIASTCATTCVTPLRPLTSSAVVAPVAAAE